MEEEVKVTTVERSHPEQVVKTTKKVTPGVITEHPQRVYEKKKVIFRSYQVIWYILGVVEFLLAARITLKAIGANPFSGFVNFIYAISDPLALPFSGIVGASVSSAAVLEWSSIIAALVYLIVAFGIANLLQFIKPVTPAEVEETVDNT